MVKGNVSYDHNIANLINLKEITKSNIANVCNNSTSNKSGDTIPEIIIDQHCNDEAIALRRGQNPIEITPKCFFVFRKSNRGDVIHHGDSKDSESLTNQLNPTQYPYEAPFRMSILPHKRSNHEIVSNKKKIYKEELLKQMQFDRMRKYKEKDLDIQHQKKMEIEFQQCYPLGKVSREVELRDVYGNTIMSRKSENLIKLEEKQSKVPQQSIRNNKVPFKEIFRNISESNPEDVLMKKFKDCHSHLSMESKLELPQVTRSEVNFARGGHGIFGQPLTDFEKQSRLIYQEELLEQIKCKQKILQAEREKEKLDEEIVKQQIEEHEIKRRKEESERKHREEERMKKLEKGRSQLLKYKQELFEQIQLKEEMQRKDRLKNREEEMKAMMIEARRNKHETEERVHIKFTEPLKLQTKKPILDVLKYQEELQLQMESKKRQGEIEKKRNLTEEEEMLRQSLKNGEKLTKELPAKSKRRFKKLDSNQNSMERFNEVKHQAELLEQIKRKQQKLVEDRLKELEMDADMMRYQMDKEKTKPLNEIDARKRKPWMNLRGQVEMEDIKMEDKHNFESQSERLNDGHKIKLKIKERELIKKEKNKIPNGEHLKLEHEKKSDIYGICCGKSDDGLDEFDEVKRLQHLDEILDDIEEKRQRMKEFEVREMNEDEIILEEDRSRDRRRSIEEREMRKSRKDRLRSNQIQVIGIREGKENKPIPSTRRHRTCECSLKL